MVLSETAGNSTKFSSDNGKTNDADSQESKNDNVDYLVVARRPEPKPHDQKHNRPNNTLPTKHTESGEKKSWVEIAHDVLVVGGVAAGIGEYSNKIGNSWKGINGKRYNSPRFFGNVHTGSKYLAIKNAEIFQIAGKRLFLLDVGLKAIEIHDDYERGEYKKAIKPVVDITIGAIGTFGGPVGFGISVVYSGVDYMINEEDIINKFNEDDKIHRNLTGRSILEVPT